MTDCSPSISGFDSRTYRDNVLSLRRDHKLHTLVLARLSALLSRAFPQAPAVTEVNATPGGRNDLIQFFHDGRRTVFELFATRSQVPQDLRLLEQCEADARIAVLLDNEVDSRVSAEFFRKRPNHFPFIWLRLLLVPRHENQAVALLRELGDENSSLRRIRRLLSLPKGRLADEALTQVVDRIEKKLLDRQNDIPSRQLNGYQCAALLAIQAIRELGIPTDRLRSLYLWLIDSIEHAFTIAACGLHPFLITDLKGQHAIWSAGDIADCMLISPAARVSANLLLDLHPIVNQVRTACGLEKQEVRWTFFHAYEEMIEKITPASHARNGNTDGVVIKPPDEA